MAAYRKIDLHIQGSHWSIKMFSKNISKIDTSLSLSICSIV